MVPHPLDILWLEVFLSSTRHSGNLVRLGEFVVDLVSGEVSKDGNVIRLKPQVCKVLSLLIATPGCVVMRDEIQRAVWGNETFVDFERGLNSCIKQIRSALGDEPDAPRYVETIPRRGYRLVAPVGRMSSLKPATPSTQAAATIGDLALVRHPVKPASIRKPTAVALLALFSIVGIAVGVVRSRHAVTHKIRMIVLPFDNLSRDPEQEFLSDGLSDELITELGKLAPQRLGVIARTSSAKYKGNRKSAAEIRSDLKVDYVLEGSVRRDGELVHVTAQLIKTNDETLIWAGSYDRALGQTLQIEDQVAGAVGRALALGKPADDGTGLRPATQNFAAHQAYLRGRYEMNRMTLEGIRKGRAYFEEAIHKDPQFALAYAAVADTYTLEPWWGGLSPHEAFPQAQAMVDQALRLDHDLAEARSALGVIHLYYDWDFAAAEKEFQRAIQLQPGLAIAHYWYAGMLSAAGRHDEAISSIQRAQELDPLSPIVNADAGWYYFYARNYDAAIQECRRAFEADPQFGFAVNCVMASHRRQGQLQAALADANQLLQIRAAREGEPAPQIYAPNPQTGLQNAAKAWLSRIDKLSKQLYISSYQVAVLHMLLDDRDQALAALNRAREQRDLLLVFLDVDPRLDALRSDPRFREFRNHVDFR